MKENFQVGCSETSMWLFHDGGLLQSKSADWSLYDNGLRHERAKKEGVWVCVGSMWRDGKVAKHWVHKIQD